MRDINLKAAQNFDAVARRGSATKAVEELGVSPSAVSQQRRTLEVQFGVKLSRRKKQRLIRKLPLVHVSANKDHALEYPLGARLLGGAATMEAIRRATQNSQASLRTLTRPLEPVGL